MSSSGGGDCSSYLAFDELASELLMTRQTPLEGVVSAVEMRAKPATHTPDHAADKEYATDQGAVENLGASEAAAIREFNERKRQIMVSLDRSPKGSLDAPIVDFLSWLNELDGVVTTSSCSGRVVTFLGASDPADSKGGEWLVISHERIDDVKDAWERSVEVLRQRDPATLQGTLVTLRFEPFLMHAECANVDIAQQILTVARDAGFRESGISVGKRRIMVQVRTLGLSLAAPIALDGEALADYQHFQVLVSLANARLAENAVRHQRLWARLRESFSNRDDPAQLADSDGPWMLTCPQNMARAVKVTIESRGWMDKSRKMVSISTDGPDASEEQPRVGLPVNEAAVLALNAAAEASSWGEVPAHEALRTPESANPGMAKGQRRTRAVRRPVADVDLDELWLASQNDGEPFKLVCGGAQSSTSAKSQRGTTRAVKEKAAIIKAVTELHAEISSQGSASDLVELLEDLDNLKALNWRGDCALLPRGQLASGTWEAMARASLAVRGGLWNIIRSALGARLLGRQKEIRVDDEVRGGAVEVLAGTGDGWVVIPGPRGVRYTLDVTKCMFSEGNAAEKDRVRCWAVQGETILDMYTGIGFWTLPLLVAGAEKVISCEWNPDAVEALQRGLALLGDDLSRRCTVLAGDNRRPEVHSATRQCCHRVLLGLIPFSRDGFPVAVNALRESGGLLHVHWNVRNDEEEATARAVAQELEAIFRRERGSSWTCTVEYVQRIKWFAPHVRHVRIDVRCSPV